MLRARVDRLVEGHTEEFGRRTPRRSQFGDRQDTRVDRRDRRVVRVSVRSTRDLPEHEPFVVVLARRGTTEAHVGLRLHGQDGNAPLRAEPHRVLGDATRGIAVDLQRRAETATGVHEDAVEHLRQRIDVVGVRRQTVRGLRATNREDPFHVQVLENARASTNRLTGL